MERKGDCDVRSYELRMMWDLLVPYEFHIKILLSYLQLLGGTLFC
jgi:hypothetical protein